MTTRTRNTTLRLFSAAVLTGLLSIASAQETPEPVRATPGDDIPDPAVSLAAQDWDALRAWFHQPQFNITDGLDTYAGDYRISPEISITRLTSR